MSSDGKQGSEREIILAKREGMAAGVELARNNWRICQQEHVRSCKCSICLLASITPAEIAARRYPLPPIEFTSHDGRRYRIRDGVLEYETGMLGDVAHTLRWDRATLQPADIRALAALLGDS